MDDADQAAAEPETLAEMPQRYVAALRATCAFFGHVWVTSLLPSPLPHSHTGIRHRDPQRSLQAARRALVERQGGVLQRARRLPFWV